MPTVEITEAGQMIKCGFCLRNKTVNMGVMTTYNPVRKPELVTVVVSNPTCCEAMPRNRTHPIQQRPRQLFLLKGMVADRDSFHARGIRMSVAIKNLKAMNV